MLKSSKVKNSPKKTALDTASGKKQQTQSFQAEVKSSEKQIGVVGTRSNSTVIAASLGRKTRNGAWSVTRETRKNLSKEKEPLESESQHKTCIKVEPIVECQEVIVVLNKVGMCSNSSSSDVVPQPESFSTDDTANIPLTDELFEDEENEKDDLVKAEIKIESELNNDYSSDSGVLAISCSSSACSSYHQTIYQCQKNDASEMHSEHSTFADNCESKDSISDNLSEVSSRHVCDDRWGVGIEYPVISQGEFLAIFKLINKSELPPPSAALVNRLHREAGGTLRRSIKTHREPQMVYKKMNINKNIHSVSRAKLGNNGGTISSISEHLQADCESIVHVLNKVEDRARRTRFSPYAVKSGKTGSSSNYSKVDNAADANTEACDGSKITPGMHDLSLLADAALAGVKLNKLTDEHHQSCSYSPHKNNLKKPKVFY